MTTATALNLPQPEQYAPQNPAAIESVHIRGFRSLADVQLVDLPKATVLIGANGSGKSNIIRFFEMVSWMLRSRRLGEFVERNGGGDDQLFGGSRVTPRIEAEISLRADRGRNDYCFTLAYAHPDRFFFAEEAFRFSDAARDTEAPWQYLDSGHREAQIVEASQSAEYPGANTQTARVITKLLRSCAVYQFHDTSDDSNFNKLWDVADNEQLRSHGGNLAAVLHRLEQEDFRRYEYICKQIGRILPGFDRFDIAERYGKVRLRWRPKWGDKTIGAHLTSDGSLRFFALATLLNLPPEMLPDVILLDEPELGLHPSAVDLVGGMINGLSTERQIIVATQSPLLVDTFELDEIFTLDLDKGQTRINRLDPEQYRIWLDDDFTAGTLWKQSFFGGQP